MSNGLVFALNLAQQYTAGLEQEIERLRKENDDLRAKIGDLEKAKGA